LFASSWKTINSTTCSSSDTCKLMAFKKTHSFKLPDRNYAITNRNSAMHNLRFFLIKKISYFSSLKKLTLLS
jgi:hypothetical protein